MAPPNEASTALAAEESFHVVIGQLVFATTQRRNQARTVITNYASRNQYTPPTITDIPAGKYGAGPSLMVTMRLANRVDADEVWADVTGNVLSNLQPTSRLWQSSVVFDAVEGTQTVTEVHRLTVPAAPDDF